MKRRRKGVSDPRLCWLPALLLGLAGLGIGSRAQAQTATTLFNFSSAATGLNPRTSLTQDAAGHFFGTTTGGNRGYGTVFELSNLSGNYTAVGLYLFSAYNADGRVPTAGVIIDSSGNLYGTTSQGGTNGVGTVFELVRSGGSYREEILYNFGSYPGDGKGPQAALVVDSHGNLYGTTAVGGTFGFGTAFELINSAGSYTERLLYSFAGPVSGGPGADGAYPYASLVMDAAGNLYGTTRAGGTFGGGVVFELIGSHGNFGEQLLYNFGAASGDGLKPTAGLLSDGAGNLFGTTFAGGQNDEGTVFELIKSPAGYSENILYRFKGGSGDGANPDAGLIRDANDNLYGTTRAGGASSADCPSGCGTAFELTRSSGVYSERILHRFGIYRGDGESPGADLMMDPSGNLYGTTQTGGTAGWGTVFEINPTATAPAVSIFPASLDFATVPAKSTSAPQAVTVANVGNADLTFDTNDSTFSGANAGDFSVSADSCSGNALPPNAGCSVNINFTPSLIGPESALLTFNDNATNVGQKVTLNAIGAYAQDFTIGIAPGSSDSVDMAQGGTATYVLLLTPLGGFNQTVTLTCAGAPFEAKCKISPATLKLNGTSASTVTVNVTTVSPNAGTVYRRAPSEPGGHNGWRWFGALLVLAMAALFLPKVPGLGRKQTLQRRLRRAALAGLLLGVTAWTACTIKGTIISPGTPAGTYLVTITATATSGPTTLSHSITLTLILEYVLQYSYVILIPMPK